MIKCYIKVSQLHNFFDLKEPIEFVPYILGEGWVEVLLDINKVDIGIYANHSTIQLKKRRSLWQKIKSIHKKN